MMAGVDLADFLLARIADDEAEATKASRMAPIHNPRDWRWQQAARDPLVVEAVTPTGSAYPLARANSYTVHAAFIAKYGPARVLIECEAKRHIVDEYTDGSDPGEWGDVALRYLALPYADHPDYREEWRP